MKKNSIFIIALLLSQQYLSAQSVTTTYRIINGDCDAQTQKIKVRPTNPNEQVILSKHGNANYLYHVYNGIFATRVEIANGFDVYDFDLYGDTIVFCGRKFDNGVYKGFIGVATFQSLFNNSSYWIPIIDNYIGFLERVLIYKEGSSLYAACYADHYSVIYKYDGDFSNISSWRYDLESYSSQFPPSDTVIITDFVVTSSSIVYVGMLNHLETSVKLYRVDRDFSLNTPSMKRFAILPNSNGNGGIITHLNKDTVIMSISDWQKSVSNVYIMDINNLSNVLRQRVRGYEEKTFPIDIIYNSPEKKIMYLQHSALNSFPRERKDVLYELQAFPTGNYQANVIGNFNIPTAVFRYNSIDLISKEKVVVCGRDFSSGLVTFIEQTIPQMPYVSNCFDYANESISVSNINLSVQTETIDSPTSYTSHGTTSYPGNLYLGVLELFCQE